MQLCVVFKCSTFSFKCAIPVSTGVLWGFLPQSKNIYIWYTGDSRLAMDVRWTKSIE